MHAVFIKGLLVYRTTRVEIISVLIMIVVFSSFAYGFRDDKPIADPSLEEFVLGVDSILSKPKILNPRVLKVEINTASDDALIITLIQPAPKYPASIITELAVDALEITRKLQLFQTEFSNRSIRFVAIAPIKPGIGFEQAEILSLDFDTATLMKIPQKKDYVFQDFLNDSRKVSYIAETGPKYVIAFCRDHVSSRAKFFCMRETNKSP